MIPGNLAAKCVENILHSRVQEYGRRSHRGGGGPSKAAGRLRSVQAMQAQLDILRDLIGRRKERISGSVDPATLGWLCAWGAGHTEAKPGLYAHLLAIHHSASPAVARCEGECPVGEVLRALVGTD
jgi:hypothetical protein